MDLLPHNKSAYESVVAHLEKSNRTCVVHPTGTGKSYIALQLIEDHPDDRILYITSVATNLLEFWDKLEKKINEALLMAEPFKDLKKAGIPNIYTYIKNNIEPIDYPTYEAAGYFIGSGAIESGNKSTMQERLKLPGMRWDIQSAQYVLSAKTKYDSGKWNSEVISK